MGKMKMDGQKIDELGLTLVPKGYRLLNTMPAETMVSVTNVDSLDNLLEAIEWEG